MSLPPLPLDPFPGFSTCSLDFPLDHIDQLYDYQLALVDFHPDATLGHKSEAELLFWRRRVARKKADLVDDGQVELDAGLRQLQRARDWLEGKAPSSRPMKDAQVQARPSTKEAQVRTGRRPPPPVPCSAAAADDDDDLQPVQSSSTAAVTPVTAPTTSRSDDPDAPPGPFFSAFQKGGASLPPAPKTLPLLNQQLHVLWVGGFTKQATRALFLAFIKHAGPRKFPRPLAISKISHSTYIVGFRSRPEVQLARRLLHNVALPKMMSKLTATPGTPGTSRTFKWSDFSDEVRGAWLRTGKLPFKWPMYVDMAPAPFKVCVSTEYQAELDRITRIESRLSSAAEAAATTAEASNDSFGHDSGACCSKCDDHFKYERAIGPAHAETVSKHPPGSLQLARMETMAAATGRNDASITSSSSSAISALPLPAPLAPRPGSGSSPSVVSLPAKLVAPLPPRPLSSASVPARPSAANASQAPAPSAPRLPAPPIAALPSEAPRPPPAPVPGGDAATSSSLIDDIFRLPSSSAATAAAAATVAPSAASHAREPPRSPPVQAFQSAHDDGHDPSSCPCCPPRPPDLHLWTPQRLASVLLNERYRHGEEAFRNLAMDFRAYVQAFGGCLGIGGGVRGPAQQQQQQALLHGLLFQRRRQQQGLCARLRHLRR
ncbi:hypothetical protein RHOSPDRAFT_26201 [Rhodotorula sp. JG-1b]|nr:hypothetical protein RHOSPDRAFT_26201 [Rhodotorula sp. JG-1b]